MKSKKLVLMALVIVLTLSLAIPAIMAANETVISGKYEEIVLDVVLMPTGKAVINPYGMPVKALDTQTVPQEIAGKTLKTAGKIATQPLVMYNKTDVDLSVGATVSASGVSGLELSTSTVSPTSADKKAQVYLEDQQNTTREKKRSRFSREAQQDTTLTGTDYTITADTAGFIGTVDGAKLVDAFNAWPASTYNQTNANQVIVNPESPITKKGIATMTKADVDGKPQAGSYVLYRLGGNCSEEPEVAWKTTDKFDVKVAFSFTPVAP